MGISPIKLLRCLELKENKARERRIEMEIIVDAYDEKRAGDGLVLLS